MKSVVLNFLRGKLIHTAYNNEQGTLNKCEDSPDDESNRPKKSEPIPSCENEDDPCQGIPITGYQSTQKMQTGTYSHRMSFQAGKEGPSCNLEDSCQKLKKDRCDGEDSAAAAKAKKQKGGKEGHGGEEDCYVPPPNAHREGGVNALLAAQPKCCGRLPESGTYPGLLRHIHNATRYTMPHYFEGGRLNVKKEFQSGMVLTQSLDFSAIIPQHTRYMATYGCGEATEGLPYVLLEATPCGMLNLKARVFPLTTLRTSFTAQMTNSKWSGWENTFDLFLPKSTASFISYNKEMFGLHYLQAVNSKLSIGAEIFKRKQRGQRLSLTGVMRWMDELGTASVSLGSQGIDIGYAWNVKPHLTIASILEKAFETLEHEQLLVAMEECGIRGPLLGWYRSYLDNRTLKTIVFGQTGDAMQVKTGVPTGSIFGPVGYIMHHGFRPRYTLATLAYEWRGNFWTARGSINSQGLVAGTLEHAIGSEERTSVIVSVSALVNHAADKFRLGLGMTFWL